jgi:hypothetical protein
MDWLSKNKQVTAYIIQAQEEASKSLDCQLCLEYDINC